MKDVLGNHLMDRSFRLVHLVEYHPRTAKDQSRPSIWKEYLTWIVPRIRFLRGREFGRVMYWADLEEFEPMDESEIYSKRLNAKQVIFHKQGEFIFQSQMDESKTVEKIRT